MTTSTQDPEEYVLVTLGNVSYAMPRDLAFKIFDTWTTKDVYRCNSVYNPGGAPKVTARPAVADNAPTIRPLTHAELHAAIAAAKAQDDASEVDVRVKLHDANVALYQRVKQAQYSAIDDYIKSQGWDIPRGRGGV